MTTIKKYRPSFTKEEISYLLLLLSSNPSASSEHVSIQKKLKLLATKIDLGITSPAYTSSPTPALTDMLGIDQKQVTTNREKIYQKQRAGEQLTAPEYSIYLDYVVANGEATKEEIEEWSKES